MSRRGPFFSIPLRPHGLSPEHAYRLAKAAEELLRERAGGGLEVDEVQIHGSRKAPWAEDYTRRLREYAKQYANVEAERREAKRRAKAEREAKREAHEAAVEAERAEAEKRAEAHAQAVEREDAESQLRTVASFLGEEIEVVE